MEVAVKIDNINKTMGKRHILKNLSFETYRGEVFGFLGPNGAGKTTTIKMAVGMLFIDSGSITICGDNVEKSFEKAIAHVGAIVENPELYKYMTGIDNLKQYARMRNGIDNNRINEVVELVGLSNRINEKVSRYSLGMRQRLGLAQALLHNPEVLILDEPTNGLDPAGIKNLRDLLKKLAHENNICVIVSSHLMSEMELMCDRVGIIANGELIDVKTIEELINASKGDTIKYKLTVSDSKNVETILKDVKDITIENTSNNSFEVTVKSKEATTIISDIVRRLVLKDIGIHSVVPEEVKSLEQVFIELTEDGGSQIA